MTDKQRAPVNRWTAKGTNRKGDELLVGSWSEKRDAGQWCRRQNETQGEASRQRGSEAPLTFEPVPVYTAPPPELVVGLPKEED